MTAERQALKATFFAFRKRDRGAVLTGASIMYLVLAFAVIAGFIFLNLNALGGFASWYIQVLGAAASGDPSAAAAITPPAGVLGVIPGLLLVMFVAYVLLAAYEAACLRWMIRGETGGLLGLTLGADTWRVYFTYWIWFFLYIAFSIAMGVAMMVVVGVFAASLSSGDGDPTAMLGVIPIFYILFYGLMIYFAVRLAPAAAASIARRRFSFFKAWSITKGRFWAIFGSYLLLYILFCVAIVVLYVVVFAVMGAALAPSLGSMGAAATPQEAMSALLPTLFAPQNIVILMIGIAAQLVLSMMLYVLLFGVNARAALVAVEEGKIDVPAPAS